MMNSLLWFRNDLRIDDNPALHHFLNQSSSTNSRKAIFFISEKQWLAHDWSPIKVDFIRRHAEDFVKVLSKYNITLSLVLVPDFASQVDYLLQYCSDHNVDNVIANSELEFNEQQRDKACTKAGLNLTLFEADVIVSKGKVLNQSGKMYKVFTPFKRAWLKHVTEFGFDYLVKPHCEQPTSCDDYLQSTLSNDLKRRISYHWPLARDYLKNKLPCFYQDKLCDYALHRDIPSIKGTSGISPYLAAGLISPRYVLSCLIVKHPDILLATDSPEFTWLNELIWREFYRHLMFHEQRLCKGECFNEKYQRVTWKNDNVLFKAWCEGKTGYPLVDAAMRQLNQTGWMHNRLRMVVASFLTKHLLIDWRLGEKYFMQHLIDGDLASNNGGWQWAASTGCDAQPYFRVFNPIKQSERFDPNGHFIRKYIPELEGIPDKKIHFPHQYINEYSLNVYWPAIVDHKTARLQAISFYK